MNVLQLFNPLFFRKHIEVVVARRPERSPRTPQRHRQLQRLQSIRQQPSLGFADQQMNMLRHYNVTRNIEAVSQARPLQRVFKERSRLRSIKKRLSLKTTESYKVQITPLLFPH